MKFEVITDLTNLYFFFIWNYLNTKKIGIESIYNNTNLVIIIIYFLGRVFKNKKLIALYHVLFAVHLIVIALFSKDKEMLLYISTTIIIVITSRKILNGCLVRKIEDKNNNISKNEFTKKLNWDYLFPLIGLIANLKLHYFDL